MLTRLTKEQSAMWLPTAAPAACCVSGYSFGHLAGRPSRTQIVRKLGNPEDRA